MGHIFVSLFILCYISPMKNFAICYNQKINNSVELKDLLYKILDNKSLLVDFLDIDNLQSGFDFVFVIGGDGTILKTARFYAKYETPVFGINLGRLGFLSQASKENLEYAVENILKNNYVIEDRIMLKSGNYTALNDFVIKGCDSGRTSSFSLKINDRLICEYLADGIIISTPTGSTAYGLSAGGPVLEPSLGAFVIVPICPHTLAARPIVVPANEKFTISTDQREHLLISADGQESYEVYGEITVQKSEYCAKLALLKDTDFYSVLKSKLNWATHPKYDEHAKF